MWRDNLLQIIEETKMSKAQIAERDFAIAENAILKDENKTLSAKVDLLSMQLNYKDEIISLYKIIEQQIKVK